MERVFIKTGTISLYMNMHMYIALGYRVQTSGKVNMVLVVDRAMWLRAGVMAIQVGMVSTNREGGGQVMWHDG